MLRLGLISALGGAGEEPCQEALQLVSQASASVCGALLLIRMAEVLIRLNLPSIDNLKWRPGLRLTNPMQACCRFH